MNEKRAGSIDVTSRGMAPRRGPSKKQMSQSTEPDFVVLLADPEVRLLMEADNVDERQLLRMLKGVSVQLRRQGGASKPGKPGRKTASTGVTRKYRRGVGIMLINSQSQIFIARRNDVPGGAWQMPQGGIDHGETARAAAYRELREEIGTSNAEIITESQDWLYYDVPEDVAKKAWGGRWKGQRQKWFVMLFKGSDADINIATDHPEFDAWRWAPVQELESLAVSFKKKLYLSVLGQFAEIFRD
jgi:putative (di)nucleoside polyphosphate hydrolase